MIRLQGISKKFGDHIIIPSIDLTIYDGEFITLLGPSGCGKTTLLRMIAGLEQPTEGKIYLDDEDVTKLPPLSAPFTFDPTWFFESVVPKVHERNTLLAESAP